MKYLLGLIICLSSAYAVDYQAPELVASSSDEHAHNLPLNTVFTDKSPTINDHGEYAISLDLVGGTYASGVWLQTRYFQGMLIESAPEDSFSNITLNNNAQIAFSVARRAEVAELYTSDWKDGEYRLSNVMNDDEVMAYSSHAHFSYNESGQLFFSAKNFKGDLGLFTYQKDHGLTLIDLQNRRSNAQRSYIFTPAYNNKGDVAYKVRLGARGERSENLPDQIILYKEGKKTILAEDRDSDQTSKYLSFRNTISLNDKGDIAFFATTAKGESLILREEDGTETVLTSKGVELKEFSYFSPVLNNKKQVAFRGIDLEGRHAIFLASKDGLQKVLTQFDPIQTPWGEASIAYGPYIPFGGNIDMNNHGDIIVNTGLATPDNFDDYGHGLVIIRPL